MAIKIEGEEEKKGVLKRVVAARLVMFAVVVVWVLGWLLAGLGLIPELFPSIWLGEGFPTHPILAFLFIWYITTLIAVGIWVAVRGFKFVGRWERE